MHDPSLVVISDTTAIIALRLIDSLELLHKLYGKVTIPSAVSDELLAGKSGLIDAKCIDWLHVKNLADPMLAALFSDLDKGEAEVIALGREMKADLLIMDERLARKYAKRLKFAVKPSFGEFQKA